MERQAADNQQSEKAEEEARNTHTITYDDRCVEYWLMLHYEYLAPPIRTVADKERMLSRVITKEPTYKKGAMYAISRIAENYPTAVENARKTVNNLLSQGLPGLDDTDERNEWLCTQCLTFSTVYEAIDFLESLKS